MVEYDVGVSNKIIVSEKKNRVTLALLAFKPAVRFVFGCLRSNPVNFVIEIKTL